MKTTKTGKLVHFAKNVITEINEDISTHTLHSCLLAKYYEDENSYYITVAPGLNFIEFSSSLESSKYNSKNDFILGNLFVYKNINKDDILDLLNHHIDERASYLNEVSPIDIFDIKLQTQKRLDFYNNK